MHIRVNLTHKDALTPFMGLGNIFQGPCIATSSAFCISQLVGKLVYVKCKAKLLKVKIFIIKEDTAGTKPSLVQLKPEKGQIIRFFGVVQNHTRISKYWIELTETTLFPAKYSSQHGAIIINDNRKKLENEAP